MNNKILFALLILLSCTERAEFEYQKAIYRRVTPKDVDSTKGFIIEYMATEDTNWIIRKSYYPNGQLWGYAYSYKGKDTGLSKAFYENGSVKFVIKHKNSEFDTGFYYNEAGKLWYLRIRDSATGYYRHVNILKDPWE